MQSALSVKKKEDLDSPVGEILLLLHCRRVTKKDLLPTLSFYLGTL